MTTFRWGILSTGNIARQFAIGLQSVDSAELVAVGSRTQESADAFAKEHNIPTAHSSYEALANDPNVDVIYIGTPHVFHAENMLLCLRAGKHVLCEKPFTINQAEAREVIDVARANNLFVMEAVWMRFIPAIVRLQALIAEGAIGDITLVKADFSFYLAFQPEHRLYNRELGGGALLDVGIYPISFTTMLLGQPQAVHSHALIGQSDVDEQCSMLFEYDNASALLTGGINGDLNNIAVIKGTEGKITVHAPFWVPKTLTLHRYGDDPQTIEVPYEGNGYNYEAEAVHTALRAGQLEHEIISHAETLATMGLMDTMRAEWGVRYPQEEA
ncbi:MAG: Gfo/Idh/MocA family protein [Anaerolineae bacterium]